MNKQSIALFINIFISIFLIHCLRELKALEAVPTYGELLSVAIIAMFLTLVSNSLWQRFKQPSLSR